MHRNRFIGLSLLIAALAATASGAFGADEALLRCRFKAGESYLIVTNLDQDIRQTIDGRENNMKQVLRLEMGLDVVRLNDDGSADVKVTYRRFTIRQQSQMGDLDYDSGDFEERKQQEKEKEKQREEARKQGRPYKEEYVHPAFAGFDALATKSFGATMDDRARITAVRGVKELAEALLKKVPAGPGREVTRKQLDRMLSQENLAQQMGALGATCPEKPVRKGDTWDKEQTMDVGFAKLTTKTKYKVENITNDVVEVSMTGTIASDAADGGEMTIRIDRGAQTGAMKIARGNAILTDADIRQKMKMTVTVRNMTIDMTLDGAAKMSVVRK